MKVLVALSGGVDSALTALLLKKQGHEVLACHIIMHQEGQKAAADAETVAQSLDIPLIVEDKRQEFEEQVVKPFLQEYLEARTPNPCFLCNPNFKFAQLISAADTNACQKVATGHYARIEENGSGQNILLQGLDVKKDQSYFLAYLSQAQIDRCLFPLGNMTKEEVRKAADKAGLQVAGKKDSQEICFIPDDDYPAFLTKRHPKAAIPGPILDQTGKQAGTHAGLPFYTIGQRKGIGAHLIRKYVVRLDKEANSVIIGDNEDLNVSSVTLKDFRWLSEPKEQAFSAQYKIRSTAPVKDCQVTIVSPSQVELQFSNGERQAAPGQAGVVYLNQQVLGAGIIA